MAPLTPPWRRRISVHAGTALLFAAMAVVWTWPLAGQLSTHVPGSTAGDNVASVWNFWWARFASAHQLDLFRTDALFAPAGTSLILHTHTALPAMIGATVFHGLSLVAAYNTLFLLTFFLNAVAAYALVYRMTREWAPGVLGAMVFAGSPFIAAHMNGHFNVLSAWTLPLVALAATEMVRGSRRWALAAGLLCGVTIYLDYYDTLYALALLGTLVLLGPRGVTFAARTQQCGTVRRDRWLLMVIAVNATAVTAIIATGGFDLSLGPITVKAHDAFNGLQLLWLLIAWWAWRRWRPRLLLTANDTVSSPATAAGTLLAIALLTSIVIASPLLIGAIRLLSSGEYVAPATFWRSGAQGIDLVTLVLGNPFSRWYGGWTREVYDQLAIDAIERSAWLGVVPIALAMVAMRGQQRHAASRWLLVGAGALLWTFGPHLTLAGQQSGMMLPQALLRYLPIVSNARIPGRALAVVYLALAVLSGVGLSRLRRQGLGQWGTAALFAVLTLDFMPMPFPLLALSGPDAATRMPGILNTLRERPERGAVCPLPLGLRDGFGEIGTLDHRVLFDQTIHERPIVGGFVARLSPSVRQRYQADPLISSLLQLSAGSNPDASRLADRDSAARSMQDLGIRFFVLDREHASIDLIRYAEQLPLTRVADEGPYSLFLVP